MTQLNKINNLEEASAWLTEQTRASWTARNLIDAGASGKIALGARNPNWIGAGVGELQMSMAGEFVSDGLISVTDRFLVTMLKHGRASLRNLPTVIGDDTFVTVAELGVFRHELMRFLDAITSKSAPNSMRSTGAPDAAGEKQGSAEPPMRYGSNSAKSYKPWIAYQASKLKQNGDTRHDLAARVVALANERNYRSEGGNTFTASSVSRLIPPGTTGTRAKNGRKPQRN